MKTEQELVIEDLERELQRDKTLRGMNAISLEQVRASFTLATSLFPTDDRGALQLAQWLCENPDATPMSIMKHVQSLRHP